MVHDKATVFFAVAIIAFLALLFPVKTVNADVSSEQSYKIQDGETLWSVADKFYGDGFKWTYLASRNNIQDVLNIQKGKIIFIPPLTSQYAKVTSQGTVFAGPSPKPLLTTSGGAKEVLASTVSLEEAVYADLAIRHYLNNVSVYSDDGKPEDRVSINADREWLPASTVKTFVAMYAYDQVDKGNLGLDDLVQVQAKNVVPTESVDNGLPALQEDEYANISRLIYQMVTQSDNTAYNVLLDVLDRRSVTDYVHSLGLSNTQIGSKLNLDDVQEQYEISTPGFGINTTTASDYSLAFQLIEQGKVPHSNDLLDIFSQQKLNNMIPLYLPKNVEVAHKTGDLDPLYHDGGIVIAPNRKYILSIFSNTGDPKIVAHISDLVYSKNFNLVGEEEKGQAPVSQVPSQSIDPMVASGKPVSQVLAAQTAPVPAITAADLGIKASDLALGLAARPSATVIIPADSRFHFIISILQATKKAIALAPDAINQANLDDINLKIAEAKDLKNRGKVTQANALLRKAQDQMIFVAKTKSIVNDAPAQSEIQSLSDARFSVLASELKTGAPSDKNKIIKEIASEAKETAREVQPRLPQASDAVSPSQKPLIAEVVNISNSQIQVRTAGGQIINVPNDVVRMKDETQPTTVEGTPAPASNSAVVNSRLSTLKKGQTIALIGASKGDKFVASLVVKNVPKELIAPQPVTVLKVDSINKRIIVSENGVPVQVNISSQAVIKGQDTNVSLQSIKVGDVVVVHSEEKQAQTNIKPKVSSSPTAQPVILKAPAAGSPSGPSSSNSISGAQPSTGKSFQPNVVNASSVQILQKKEDVGKSVSPAPSKSSVNQPSSKKEEPKKTEKKK